MRLRTIILLSTVTLSSCGFLDSNKTKNSKKNDDCPPNFKCEMGLFSSSAETTNREASIPAFEENFGFKPSESIKEIKLKNRHMVDATGHYMVFTYDSLTLKKILKKDSPLEKIVPGTYHHKMKVNELNEKDASRPAWFSKPTNQIDTIYFKKDFLDHNYSDYHLWVNKKQNMIYLTVSYFD